MSKDQFINIVETIADNKYVLGDRLVEVGFSGADVESILSAVAMAQGELGHARLLYHWVFDLEGKEGRKPDIKEETGKSFREVREINSLVKLIAGFFTTNVAIDILFDAMMKSGHSDIQSRLNKLYLEHKEHCLFSESWAMKLLNDEGHVPKQFSQDLNDFVSEVEQWFQEVQQSASELKEYLGNENLLERFQSRVQRLKQKGVVASG